MGGVIGPGDPGPVGTPRYGERSLAELLPSVAGVLRGGPDPLGLADVPVLAGVRRFVVLLLDGLGAHLPIDGTTHLAAATALPSLTSGFPSTTPTSLVTLSTGVPPGEHGVVGFTVAVPGTDRLLNHLAWRDDPPPRTWQPVRPVIDRLGGAVVGPPEFVGGGLSIAQHGGARYLGATGNRQIADQVAIALADHDLVSTYLKAVDHAAHQPGPLTPTWYDALAEADDLVGALAAVLPADAALLVTADHGVVRIDESDKIDLDALPDLFDGVRLLAGEPRVRYVHTVPGAADDVLSAWRATLAGVATVATRDEAIAAGWYGPTVTADAAARIGDLVVLGTDRHALFRRTMEPEEASLAGLHGGLTEAEIAVPLRIVRR